MFHIPTRTRNLLLAAVLAVAAAALTMLYVDRARGTTKPDARPQTTVPVLVATRDLPVGTSVAQALSSGAVAVRKLDAESVEPGALVDAATARAEVVLQPIYSGEQLAARRVGASGTGGLPSQLTGTLRVLQVPGDADQLLASTVRDGDHVDVVASVKSGTDQTPSTQVVLRDIVVLQAPDSADSSSGDQLSATVQLTDRQAKRLFYVMQNGDWSFLLRPVSHVAQTKTAPATAESVLEGS